MRPTYKQNEFGKFVNGEMVALLQSLDQNGEAAAFIRILAAEVEKELKVINTQSFSHKNIGSESALELIAAMLACGYWTPRLMKGKYDENGNPANPRLRLPNLYATPSHEGL